MVASLPARTTVLAAANPVEGSYNKGRTLLVRLCGAPALLAPACLLGGMPARCSPHLQAVA